MNQSTVNVGLQTIATGLVALGATSIGANLLGGAIEIVLGIIVYTIYEFTPAK